MKHIKGIWLPDDEEHLLRFATEEDWTYQYHKLRAALKYVRKFDLAIDVGAHCGLWTKELARLFKEVHAYEPLKEHVECLRKNAPGVKVHHCLLGDHGGRHGMYRYPGQSACSWMIQEGNIVMNQLDDSVLAPDFIKIDCEGYEYFVLRGATETLKHKPVVIVEQKPGNAGRYGLEDTEAVKYLQSLGATLREEIAGDYILSW